MKTVQEWEYTSRFGAVGKERDSWANNARVVDYFSDCYPNSKEALYKAEIFLSVHDYLGRNAPMFARRNLLEEGKDGVFSVESSLLRALHYAFTVSPRRNAFTPKQVANLARAIEEIG